MSVRTWKKIITFTVLGIILVLTISTILLSIKVSKLNEEASNPIIDTAQADSMIDYQNKYPDLYVENDFEFKENDGKVCYLTFDDGPTIDNTTRILDTLKQYNVKATFFVIYREGAEAEALYKRIVDEGHTIAIHTASHNYTDIYASVDAYLEDFNKVSTHVESITGVRPSIFRFPGGSLNSYNMEIYQELIAEMTRRGYVYYDWTDSSGDAASGSVSVDTIVNNSIKNEKSNYKVVLMHDGPGHQNTAAAVPTIVETLIAQGYTLAPLNNDVKPVFFGYWK